MNQRETEMFLQQEQMRANVEMQKEIAKANIKVESQLRVASEKMRMREANQQRRKSQFESVEISDTGEVLLKTQNTLIDSIPRRLTNLRCPVLTELRNFERQKEKLYVLECSVNSVNKTLFFNEEKVGNPTYILKKIRSIGGIVFADLQSDEKKYVLRFWGMLVLLHREIIWLPERGGWFEDGTHKIRFCREGSLTWREAEELAK